MDAKDCACLRCGCVECLRWAALIEAAGESCEEWATVRLRSRLPQDEHAPDDHDP